MIVGSGDQRRIPSVVIVDHPHLPDGSTVITNHDNQQSEDPNSVEQKDTIKGKVSPGSGRLLPYVPKRYVIPRVPAGISSPSASSSSATTAKRIIREVSFEDELIEEDDLDDGTDINAPDRRMDSFVETDEYVNDESGIENNQDTNGDVSDVGVVGNGVALSLPAILRDYLGPAPSTAADVPRKRGDVISPAPQDDIARQLFADLNMGPFNKEFDPLTPSLNGMPQRSNLTTDDVSNAVTNVDLLTNHAAAEHSNDWETQFSSSNLLGTTERPYQTDRDRRITSDDISTTIDTYGTYRRGRPSGRNITSYKKLSNYMDGSLPYHHHDEHMVEDSKLDRSESNQYNQSFYDDDFLTESEKERLSYLRSIGTSSRGYNGTTAFNRRTSDSLLDTSYHHSNLYEPRQDILTPTCVGTSIIPETVTSTKEILPVTQLPGGLASTDRSPQYGNDVEVQRMILEQDQNHLEDGNRYSVLRNDVSSTSNIGNTNPFDDVPCKYLNNFRLIKA